MAYFEHHYILVDQSIDDVIVTYPKLAKPCELTFIIDRVQVSSWVPKLLRWTQVLIASLYMLPTSRFEALTKLPVPGR